MRCTSTILRNASGCGGCTGCSRERVRHRKGLRQYRVRPQLFKRLTDLEDILDTGGRAKNKRAIRKFFIPSFTVACSICLLVSVFINSLAEDLRSGVTDGFFCCACLLSIPQGGVSRSSHEGCSPSLSFSVRLATANSMYDTKATKRHACRSFLPTFNQT